MFVGEMCIKCSFIMQWSFCNPSASDPSLNHLWMLSAPCHFLIHGTVCFSKMWSFGKTVDFGNLVGKEWFDGSYVCENINVYMQL